MGDITGEVMTPQQLTAFVLDNLGMKRTACTDYDLYTNDSSGFLRLYGKPGLYTFGVADYTISHSFSARFAATEKLLRFGALYDGATTVRLANGQDRSSKPSVYITLQQRIEGEQLWVAGQHLSGAEFTIYPAYLQELEG